MTRLKLSKVIKCNFKFLFLSVGKEDSIKIDLNNYFPVLRRICRVIWKNNKNMCIVWCEEGQ